MITLHLFRTSMANCTRPLMRSLMMDNVPKRHRGAGNIDVCSGLLLFELASCGLEAGDAPRAHSTCS